MLNAQHLDASISGCFTAMTKVASRGIFLLIPNLWPWISSLAPLSCQCFFSLFFLVSAFSVGAQKVFCAWNAEKLKRIGRPIFLSKVMIGGSLAKIIADWQILAPGKNCNFSILFIGSKALKSSLFHTKIKPNFFVKYWPFDVLYLLIVFLVKWRKSQLSFTLEVV